MESSFQKKTTRLFEDQSDFLQRKGQKKIGNIDCVPCFSAKKQIAYTPVAIILVRRLDAEVASW